MMGQGTKVCVKIVAMACDAGLVRSDQPVLAIAGTGRGADTVLLIWSANSRRFFDFTRARRTPIRDREKLYLVALFSALFIHRN